MNLVAESFSLFMDVGGERRAQLKLTLCNVWTNRHHGINWPLAESWLWLCKDNLQCRRSSNSNILTATALMDKYDTGIYSTKRGLKLLRSRIIFTLYTEFQDKLAETIVSMQQDEELPDSDYTLESEM